MTAGLSLKFLCWNWAVIIFQSQRDESESNGCSDSGWIARFYCCLLEGGSYVFKRKRVSLSDSFTKFGLLSLEYLPDRVILKQTRILPCLLKNTENEKPSAILLFSIPRLRSNDNDLESARNCDRTGRRLPFDKITHFFSSFSEPILSTAFRTVSSS